MASSLPATDDSAEYADRRAFPRVPVALPAFLVAGEARHAVQILDLSAGGAKLDCPASVAAGTAVTIDCGSLRRTAVVRWQNAGIMGVCFDSELDARDVSSLIGRSEAMAAWRKTRG